MLHAELAPASDKGRCASCGAFEANGVKFQRCCLCVSGDVAQPALYCGKECQRADWPRHKRWHRLLQAEPATLKTQNRFVDEQMDAHRDDVHKQRSVQETDAWSRLAKERDNMANLPKSLPSSKYFAIMKEVDELRKHPGNARQAVKKVQKAVKIAPDCSIAHWELGSIYDQSGEHPLALRSYLDCMKCSGGDEPFSRQSEESWAMSCALAFNLLTLPACHEVEQPPWFTDDTRLMAVAGSVFRILSGSGETANRHLAWAMKACVLTGQVGGLEGRPRSPANLREAARCLQRAAKEGCYGSTADGHMRNAARMNGLAESMEASGSVDSVEFVRSSQMASLFSVMNEMMSKCKTTS